MILVFELVALHQIVAGHGVLTVEDEHLLLDRDEGVHIILEGDLQLTQQGDRRALALEAHLLHDAHEVPELLDIEEEQGVEHGAHRGDVALLDEAMDRLLIEGGGRLKVLLFLSVEGEQAHDFHLFVVDLHQPLPEGELLLTHAEGFVGGGQKTQCVLVFTAGEDFLAEHLDDLVLLRLTEQLDEGEQLQVVVSPPPLKLDGTADVHGGDAVLLAFGKVGIAQRSCLALLVFIQRRQISVEFLEGGEGIAGCCVARPLLFFFQCILYLLEPHGFLPKLPNPKRKRNRADRDIACSVGLN